MTELELDRERDLRAVVLDALRLLGAHFPVFFTATLIVVAPVVFVVDGLLGRTLVDGLDASPSVGITLLSTFLTSFVVPPLVTALHVRAVQGIAVGEEPHVGAILGEAVRLFPLVVVPVVLYALGVALGLVIIVPGIYVAVLWFFNVQAVVVEDHRGPDALRRSTELVKGQWFRVAGILLVLSLLATVLGVGVASILVAFSDSGPWITIATTFAQTIAISISALGGTLLFFDLRHRKGEQTPSIPDAFGNFLPPRG